MTGKNKKQKVFLERLSDQQVRRDRINIIITAADAISEYC